MSDDLRIETRQDYRRACVRGAIRGLASQGWRRAALWGGGCVARTAGPDPLRCATRYTPSVGGTRRLREVL